MLIDSSNAHVDYSNIWFKIVNPLWKLWSSMRIRFHIKHLLELPMKSRLFSVQRESESVTCSPTHIHLPEQKRSGTAAAPSPWQPLLNSDAGTVAIPSVAIETRGERVPKIVTKNYDLATTTMCVGLILTSSSRVSSSSSSSWLWFNLNWILLRTSRSSRTRASLYLVTHRHTRSMLEQPL